jgi:NAD(P)-dependent dehydrogenase (short-subunit alcohol dehydrogenase family)
LKVHNKTVAVTGGANGIGREIVLLLLKKGARVAVVDIDEAAMRSLLPN